MVRILEQNSENQRDTPCKSVRGLISSSLEIEIIPEQVEHRGNKAKGLKSRGKNSTKEMERNE